MDNRIAELEKYIAELEKYIAEMQDIIEQQNATIDKSFRQLEELQQLLQKSHARENLLFKELTGSDYAD